MKSWDWLRVLVVAGVLAAAGAIISAVDLGAPWAVLTGVLAGQAVVCGWCAFGIYKLRKRMGQMGASFGGPPAG